MEIIALITAMADARAGIQASLREIRNYPRRNAGEDIDETLEACHSMLRIIQTHLAYISRRDSLLVIPGTNADKNGQINWYVNTDVL